MGKARLHLLYLWQTKGSLLYKHVKLRVEPSSNDIVDRGGAKSHKKWKIVGPKTLAIIDRNYRSIGMKESIGPD